MQVTERRRPIRARSVGLSQRLASRLAETNVTPNQISILSVIFAAIAAALLLALPYSDGIGLWLLPVLAALFIEGRLLCNMLDGLVAVEGGKATPAGELYNEVPDRVADLLVLAAAGYATTVVGWTPALGWCAAALAIMAAYVRALATSMGAPADFQGPMSKPQRMHLLAAACLLTAVEPFFWTQGVVLVPTLIVLVLGTAMTIVRRTRAAYHFLERRHVS